MRLSDGLMQKINDEFQEQFKEQANWVVADAFETACLAASINDDGTIRVWVAADEEYNYEEEGNPEIQTPGMEMPIDELILDAVDNYLCPNIHPDDRKTLLKCADYLEQLASEIRGKL